MEKNMSWVRGVLNYAGCFAEAAGSLDRVNGWEAGLSDGLGYKLLQFLAVLARAGAIPSCDTARKNASYGASVKVYIMTTKYYISWIPQQHAKRSLAENRFLKVIFLKD